MWAVFYEYLRLRQEKLASSSSAENADVWSNIDLPSITITSLGPSSSSSSRRRQRHGNSHSNQIQYSNRASVCSENDTRCNNRHGTLPAGCGMPLLYSLARNWAFSAVAFRCQTNPEEASSAWIDDQGDNALHWVVFGNPPLHVVQELLLACPDLARRPNKNQTLPLHVACSYRASTEVIAALLDGFPQAAGMTNGVGSYPLHLVCDYGCSVDTLHRLLQTPAAIPTLHQLDRLYQRRPLDILNARKNMRQCHQARQTMRQLRQLQQAIIRNEKACTVMKNSAARHCSGHSTAADENHNVATEERLQQLEQQIMEHGKTDFWRKAALLITAQHTGEPLLLVAAETAAANDLHDADDSCNIGGRHGCGLDQRCGAKILQAAIASNHNCPPSLQEFAILLYQPFLLVPDNEGRLPLHVAVAAATTYSTGGGGTTANNALVLDLIEACPQAARVRDSHGHFPLILALQRQQQSNPNRRAHFWKGSLQALVEAYPAALEELDLPNVLLPRIWSNFASPNTLFESLRAPPRKLFRSYNVKERIEARKIKKG